MKSLNGRELADYVKERQAHQVRSLRARGVVPRLAIFYDNDSPVIETYMRLKRNYGADIGIEVECIKIDASSAEAELRRAADDSLTHGMIVQLPLKEVDMAVLDLIPYEKDVDGLRGKSDTATAMAIHWLLTGYDIDLHGKRLAIVGRGKLVGAPLERMWRESGYDVTVFVKGDDLSVLRDYDVIVTATGVPGVITSAMIRSGAVVVDAGTASENGVIKGDLSEDARERSDFIMTPKIGGVGPLTVTMLFEQVIKAASA